MFLVPKKSKNKIRPLTLASCMLKLVEKLIAMRIIFYIEKEGILPEEQHGFRKFRSCTTSIATLVTEIHRAFNEDSHASCLSLDIKSAFNFVDPKKLQEILTKYKFPYKIKKFIYNLMVNRNLYFKINHELKKSLTRSLGVPQGCVLSPIYI